MQLDPEGRENVLSFLEQEKAEAETPVMRLFREWQPLADWLNGPEGDAASQPDFDRVNAARIALEDRM